MSGRQVVSGVKAFASSIVDTYNPKASLLPRLYHRVLTGFYLSQIKGSFMDFSKSEFPATATSIYSKLYESAKKHDKSALQEVLTIPNYDLFKMCLKNRKPLPYQLYKTVSQANIVHCRLTSEKGNQVETQTFAHVTVLFHCKSESGEQREQLGIYERRIDNKQPYAWKIAFIEDLKEK